MGRLEGKVAVITGGASGIGEATSPSLPSSHGAAVVIADVQDERGRRLAGGARGPAVAYSRTDVRREERADGGRHRAGGGPAEGRLDCLFNNAGRGWGQRAESSPSRPRGSTTTIGPLLVRAVLLGMKHAAPIMRRQRSGSIISTASVAGLRGGWGPHVYSAAKAAVIQLTRSIAMELAEAGSGSIASAPARLRPRSSGPRSGCLRRTPKRPPVW